MQKLALDLRRVQNAAVSADVARAPIPSTRAPARRDCGDGGGAQREAHAIQCGRHRILLLSPEQWEAHNHDFELAINVAGAWHPNTIVKLEKLGVKNPAATLLPLWEVVCVQYITEVTENFCTADDSPSPEHYAPP